MAHLNASRIAGLKLFAIVLVLMTPLIVLAQLLNGYTDERLEAVQKQVAGLEVVKLINPLYLLSQPKDLEAFKLNGQRYASEIGLNENIARMADLYVAKPENADKKIDQARLLLIEVAQKSNLILDQSPELHYLASGVTSSIPNLSSEISKLEVTLRQPLPVDIIRKDVAEKAGRLAVAMEALQSDIERAAASRSTNQDSRSIAKTEFATLQAMIGEQVKVLNESAPRDDRRFQAAADGFSAEKPRLLAALNRIAADATKRLDTLTSDSLDGLDTSRKWTLLSVVAAALAGIGAALAMFRTTFSKLDTLGVAKSAAETAHRDAESMNAKLSAINNDIVHLNQELADKMRRLKDAQDELLKRGRLEQLGQLTATVAHEMRNPLGAVRTSAFLLERKIKDKGLGVEPQLQRINNGIQRCDSIITQLLDFSRTKQIDAVPADLDEWLVGVVEEEARRLPAAVEISCSLGLEGRTIPFDPARMQRVVINLISNASEAMVGTGEDASKYTVRNPKISVVTKVENEMAVLEITDNGPGIGPEIIEKIREPLFTTKSFGTGLGIPAVDQIATQHGGRLEITSALGQGARFSVLLPLVNSETLAA